MLDKPLTMTTTQRTILVMLGAGVLVMAMLLK
jgi:hypothetical protein